MALVVWKLANTGSPYSITNQLTVEWTMAITAMHEVCDSLLGDLGPGFIQLRNLHEVIVGFE